MLKNFHCRLCGCDLPVTPQAVVICENHMPDWRRYGKCIEPECGRAPARNTVVCETHRAMLVKRASA